jgi:protein ImuA
MPIHRHRRPTTTRISPSRINVRDIAHAGKVLWCITRPDLFAPALAQAGLVPDRVIYVEAGDEKSVLICFEEGLRHGGLGAVVAEVARLSMTGSITRWRVSALPATPLPVPGVGRARWQLELIRCRAGESADFEVEACDAKGRLALPSGLVHGPAAKDIGRGAVAICVGIEFGAISSVTRYHIRRRGQ